ncbi:MAG TPA: AGE family epimerase/isomerase [Candidatus Eremiobacteraceae bacterium]|nr:AGE family epimerase/isomerase [Candidatus Eremiobacteraceae bacterium]
MPHVDLKEPRTLLERLLLLNQLPFWEPVLDTRDGGYHLNHDGRGRWRGSAHKFLVAQARTLWFFSRVARSPYGDEDHRHAARHGYDFLRSRMWDAEYGGFYWCASSSGHKIVQSGKHVYGQSFALFALSEYAQACGDATATDFAKQLFQLLDYHAHDPTYGGYRECLAREWSPAKVERGYIGHPPAVKSMNTHLHLLEAITAYAGLDDRSVVRERLEELRTIICEKAVCREPTIGAFGVERHGRDWSPYQDEDDRRVSYGHDVEAAWLLMDADVALGKPETASLDVGQALFEHALRFGYDSTRGGFYETGHAGKPADRRSKLWWVQAEGMLGALRLYRATGGAHYASCFQQMLGWIVNHQADWKFGEWHSQVDERSRPSGNKAGPWKEPYHNGRAVLECLKILKDLALPSRA